MGLVQAINRNVSNRALSTNVRRVVDSLMAYVRHHEGDDKFFSAGVTLIRGREGVRVWGTVRVLGSNGQQVFNLECTRKFLAQLRDMLVREGYVVEEVPDPSGTPNGLQVRWK